VTVTNSYGVVTSSVAALTVVTAPIITRLALVSTNTILDFSTANGATYFLEQQTNFTAGSWLTTLSNVAGVGGTKTVTNFGGGAVNTRFYRVRVTVP
jgi:hypothetical protein